MGVTQGKYEILILNLALFLIGNLLTFVRLETGKRITDTWLSETIYFSSKTISNWILMNSNQMETRSAFNLENLTAYHSFKYWYMQT